MKKENFKHTPGPWGLCFDTNGYHTGGIGSRNNGNAVASVHRPFNAKYGVLENTDESLANARLIAAAPDLLLACQEALRDLLYFGAKLKSITELELAISKALGE